MGAKLRKKFFLKQALLFKSKVNSGHDNNNKT